MIHSKTGSLVRRILVLLGIASLAVFLMIGQTWGPLGNSWFGGQQGKSLDSFSAKGSIEKPTDAHPPKLSQEDWLATVVPHLDKCNARIESAIGPGLEPITELINRAEIRASGFSEVALSLGSKWRLAKDYVPFSKGGEHETYLRQEFEEKVLRSSELESVIRSSIESVLREMNSVEGQMLVELRADLEDLPVGMTTNDFASEELKIALENAIRMAELHSTSDFNGAVGQQLVSLIAGEVLAHTAVRLGVSAGILGVGASSGWATFGIGVIAGVLVDSLVSTVWNMWSDPESELTSKVQAKLNLMRQLILEGDQEQPGLRPRLVQLAITRGVAREQALRALLMENP